MRIDRDEVLREAKKRFRIAYDANQTAYQHWEQDWKFGHGDSYNHYQWPEGLPASRAQQGQLSLTINKTRQHCMNIINSICAAETAIKYTAIAAGATDDAAEAWEGLSRAIEYRSNARSVYRNAVTHMVFGGLGWWRIATEYEDDQQHAEIKLRQVMDPTRVFFDPDANEPDGSDANHAFVFDEIDREEFERLYPGEQPSGNDHFGMIWRGGVKSEEKIGIVEYFRRHTTRERVFYLENGDVVRGSELGAEIRQRLRDDGIDSRMVDTHEVQYFKLCGDSILEKSIWLGKYIPIVPLFGEVTTIDGTIDRAGHVRCMLDPQRMYNFNRSAQTMAVALQTKVPWVTAAEAISGHETYWQASNTQNFPYLTYNAFSEDGRPIPPPQRNAPAMAPEAYIAGVEGAAQDLQMVSGQFEAAMGEPSNERSGVAIQARQSAIEVGAQQYQAAFEQALRLTGKIILDLAPHVYTKERVLAILGKDGKQTAIKMSPMAQQAYAEVENRAENEAAAIFNPNVGKYEVQADIGPGFLTQRQQAFEALQTVIKASPEWVAVLGDLLMRNAPFPEAEEMAERLYRMIPPQALGGMPPQVMAMQHQMQQMQQALGETMQKLSAEKAKGSAREQQKGIDAYRAETDRLSALKDIDPAILVPIIRQAVAQALTNPMSQIDESIHDTLQSAPAPQPQLQQSTGPQQQAQQPTGMQ